MERKHLNRPSVIDQRARNSSNPLNYRNRTPDTNLVWFSYFINFLLDIVLPSVKMLEAKLSTRVYFLRRGYKLGILSVTLDFNPFNRKT